LPDYGIAIISFSNRTYAPMISVNSEVINYLIDKKIITKKNLSPTKVLQTRADQLMQLLLHSNFNNSVLEKEIFAINFFLDFEKRFRKEQFDDLVQKLDGIVKVGEVQPINNLRSSSHSLLLRFLICLCHFISLCLSVSLSLCLSVSLSLSLSLSLSAEEQ
jgi:hypothetical protein